MKTLSSKLSLILLSYVALGNALAQDTTAQITTAPVFYQNLRVVGTTPSEEENAALLIVINQMKIHGPESNLPGLESFVTNYPTSSWVPSVRANLARYYYDHGRYTRALTHWENVWNATRYLQSGPGKEVADFTFAYWTKLLASLGRVDDLTSLFSETQGRVFDSGPLQQVINGTMEGYRTMLSSPGICFKCGTFALNNVARILNAPSIDPGKFLLIPSPSTGFTMTMLANTATQSGLDLVPAQWGTNETFVIPSVIHWTQNHYAALLEETNGLYRVLDPTFGKERWLKASALMEEASGYFLVPRGRLPNGWRMLSTNETDQIYGRGFPDGITDPTDSGCGGNNAGGNSSGSPDASNNTPDYVPQDASGGGQSGSACQTCGGNGGGYLLNGGAAGSTGGGAAGGSGAGCKPPCSGGNSGGPGGNGGNSADDAGYATDARAVGSPIWEVSDPFISVWLYDRPLGGYRAGVGYPVSPKLAYKQRESRTFSPNFFGFGTMWDSTWTSFLIFEGDGDTRPELTIPGGGQRDYYETYPHEYFSGTTLTLEADGSGVTTGYSVGYASGARDDYGFIPTAQIDMKKVALLTAKVDPFGHTNRFIYVETNSIVKLLCVIDADGRTNSLFYTNTLLPNYITSIQDPFSHTAYFIYNSDTNSVGSGKLTNIIDVVGLSSSFKYDSQGWVTNLITPYGTTAFYYTTNTGGINEFDPANSYLPTRTVRIVDPAGGTNVYMLRQDSSVLYTNLAALTNDLRTPFVGDTYNPAVIPTNGLSTNLISQLDYQGLLYYRNTFHWGPRQAGGLASDLNFLQLSDYKGARMRHWRHDAFVLSHLGPSISIEQEPSPDGIHDGQTTWYGYYGNSGPAAGAYGVPDLIARVLPDGTTWYRYLRQDEWYRPTNIVETYSTGFGQTPLLRTNVYIFSGADLAKHIGPRGETLAGYAYDGNHDLTSATNAVGDFWLYTYDAQGRLTSIKSPAGLTTTNIYFGTGDYANWVQTRIDLEINRTNSFTYTNDLVCTHSDERGLVTTYDYDALSRVTSVSDSRGTISYTYDKLDLVQTVDHMGFTNSYAWDAVRRLTAVTNALGRFTLYNYCSCGALDSTRDAEGNFTYYFYDNAGRLLNTVFADSYSTTNNFNVFGQITNTVDSAGTSVTNWFDNQGLRYAATTAAGNREFIDFDDEDRATNIVNSEGVSVAMTYDSLGRLLTRAYYDGSESFGYSAAGLVAYTNQIGMTNFFAYDAAARKTFETNANQELIRYTNNAAGDLLSLTDGKNQTTRWNYDEYGRVTNKLDQAGTEILRDKYDADNRLTNRWSAAKGSTAYSYDSVGNLSSVQYPASGTVTFSYDGVNRMTNMVDGIGTTKYTYSAAGQLLTEDGPYASDTVTSTYSNRLRIALSLQQPAGSWTNGFAYDITKRLTNVTSSAGSFGYLYGPTLFTHHPERISLPNTSYITNLFDADARLIATYLKNSGNTVLDSYGYIYNPANQRTNLTRADASTVAYKYDSIGQLTVADSSVSSEDRGYTYDSAWNLNFRTNNGVLGKFTVDNKNELTNALGLAKKYDSNGNLTNSQSGTTIYAYDDENRLTAITNSGSWASQFTYDGLGRLRSRLDYTFVSMVGYVAAGQERYIYDGRRVIQERDGSNNPLVSYTRGNDLSGTMEGAGGIGGLLALSSGYSGGNFTTHNYYFADGNGNVTFMLNSSQTMVASYRYDPFGNTVSSSGTLASANVYRFSSKEIHANSGLYYYGYRFYDPNLQRWINRDPIQEWGGRNLYAFVNDSPFYFIDPFGLAGMGELRMCEEGRNPFPYGPDVFRNLSNYLDQWTSRQGIGPHPFVKYGSGGPDLPLPPIPPDVSNLLFDTGGGTGGWPGVPVLWPPLPTDSSGSPTNLPGALSPYRRQQLP